MIKVDQELIPIKERFAQEYNLSKVLKKWNHPEKNIPTINVVGTNGKGSTSFLLSQNLKQKYSKVGLFISPAFIYHNERIQINNEMISDQDLRKYLAMIEEDIQEYKLTFFEIWTLMMILYFNDQKVDIAVVEAGIGGVKDATSLMSNQLMTLLTSVSLDHTDVLGADVEHILKQKLGIVKPETIFIISIDNLQYKKAIDKILQVIDIEVIWAKKFVDPIYYQQGNKGLVFETLKILKIKNYDLTMVPFLGRYTELKSSPKWVIDGAHNLDGISQLIQTTRKQNWQPIVLFGSSSHKNHQEILALLNQNFAEVFITNFDHLKSWDISQINMANKVNDWKQFLIENNDKDILICGSLYFIPLVYEWFYNRG